MSQVESDVQVGVVVVGVVVVGVVVVGGAESDPLPHDEVTNRNVRAIAYFLTVGSCHPPHGVGRHRSPHERGRNDWLQCPHGSDPVAVQRHSCNLALVGTRPGAQDYLGKSTPSRQGVGATPEP